ncbi:hypothetical protein XA26_21020 [Mycolicibacterium fortuitum]|uniref:Uncharacterized protein n=1 Tax=Mycolicibacterium fortuitum TaxID=1766 RepID=A0A0N9XZS9_MYCFO|nr:hypothetical protein XA26_21020 [Mycolicibacterium fortuitum]
MPDGPVERGQPRGLGNLEGLVREGLCGRGRAFAGLSGGRGRHADGDDESDCGRRCHRRSTSRTSRHVTPSQCRDVDMTSQLTAVTLVINGVDVTSDALIGTVP